eukprot:TRINITY_DN12760_c1_g1_i2.p1 TRINITY_DN12760_c1_g1~~TRINITY_DN12760_c1_g1_i2.p1  ORF type:complete len:1139 (+),score=217.49 TRINITY_DN12760_c1_g1_i2:110-3526(+)
MSMTYTAPITVEGVPVATYIDAATRDSLDLAYMKDVGTNLKNAGFDISSLAFEGVHIFVTDMQVGRITFTAGFKNNTVGAEAAAFWEVLKLRKEVLTTNLIQWYAGYGFNKPIQILWPANDFEQDSTGINTQKYLDELRIGSSTVIDEHAKMAAKLNNEMNVQIPLKTIDSSICLSILSHLNCNNTMLLVSDTETVCQSECHARVSAFMHRPYNRHLLTQECSTQTITNILELDILRCTKHRGEYCFASTFEGMFLPLFKSISSGIVYSELDLSTVLHEQCNPCVGKIAHAMSRFNDKMTFLGFSEPAIDTSAWRFLKIACLKSKKGNMCLPKLQGDFIKGVLSGYNSSDMCGDGEEQECRLLSAAAYEEGSLQTQGILLTCIRDENGGLCGDHFATPSASSTTPRSLILSTALGSIECNMAAIAYSGTGNCLKFMNATQVKHADFCQEVSDSCCMREALLSNVNRGLYTPNELEKGLEELCPGAPSTGCGSSSGSVLPLQVVVQGASEFLNPNSQEIQSRLRADISLATGISLTQIKIDSWDVISPSSAAITFSIKTADPEVAQEKINNLLLQKQLASGGLTQEMYSLRYNGIPFHVKYESSAAGSKPLRRARSPNEDQCSNLKKSVDAVCQNYAQEMDHFKDGVMTTEFCSSTCFSTIKSVVSDAGIYCPTAYAAKLSYISELGCFSTSCTDTYERLDNITESIKMTQLDISDLDNLCKESCARKMLTAYQRYTARMHVLGVKVLRDDIDSIYRFMVLKTACITTRDAGMKKCLSSIAPIISSANSLLSSNTADVCLYSNPEHRSCIRKVLKLATEDLLAMDTLPSNITGVFKSQCVLTGSDDLSDRFCSQRYAKVQLDHACDPFKLNGTISKDSPCRTQLQERHETLGCCDWHLLQGHLESLIGQNRIDQEVAYHRTMAAISRSPSDRCSNKTYGSTITRLRIRVDAKFDWCSQHPKDCEHAFTADILQNTGLHSGNIVDMRLSEGSTVATLSVQIEGSKENSDAVADTFINTNTDDFIVTNVNDWSKDYTPDPVLVLDISADSVESEEVEDEDSSTPWMTIGMIAVGSTLGIVSVMALIKRRQKSPPRDRASSKMTEEPLDLTEMGKVATPSSTYFRGNAPGSPAGEGADTMTI